MSDSPLSVVFFGTPEFSCLGLAALVEDARYKVKVVITQPDRPAGRGNQLRACPVKEYAVSKGIPVLQPQSIKREGQAFLDALNAYGPFDIGVVIAFGQILPLSTLNVPKAGCVNVHASLLPRWRGAAPLQRAIMAGDVETGVCLMRMEQGLDTGGVFSLEKFPITPTTTLETLHDALAQLGAVLLRQDLASICSGDLKSTPQPEEGVTYAHKISNEDSRIDWSKNALEIDRQIRALNPFPGAYTLISGKRLKIFRTQVKGDSSPTPGSIVRLDKHLLEVACGSGTLALEEVQIEGKKRLPVDEYLKGAALSVGMCFDRA